MKWLTVPALAGVLFSAQVLSAEDTYPRYPQVNFSQCQKPAAAKRGEYLVKMGDCIACHTAKNGGTPFAGGTELKVPFGPFHFTFYGPNITSDKATGIGRWSEDEFIRAMRDGVSPHGLLYPAFPYLWFNRVKTEDLKDIKSYLDCLPPVHNQVPNNQMLFPFNIRFLQMGWRILFFDFYKQQWQENPSRSKEWNRGSYIVEGLGHCGMCHTPMNALGGPKRKYAYTGGIVEGFLAPNISAAALKDTPINNITDVFLKDKLIGGQPGSVQGGMLEVNHDSLQYLTPADLRAIATYLKTIESEQPPKPKVGSGDNAGEGIYESSCAACHTSGAGGAPKLGDASAWNPRIAEGLSTLYTHALDGYKGMPAKGACATCTVPEVEAAVRYLVNQAKGGAAEASTPKGPAYPPLTLKDGAKIYQKSCATCHAEGKNGAIKLGDKSAWAPVLKPGFDIVVGQVLETHSRLMGSKLNDAELIAATKYMANESSDNDYSLW